jgi:nitrite reductase/ring-hydroxylating ferredoxin subunit
VTSSARRRALALVGVGLPAVAFGCAPREPPDRRVRVPLKSLDPAGRFEVEYAGEPAEVVLTASGLVARSLLCSHFGCRVQWEAAKDRYHCPCHEGAFDREGRPIAGPPTRPLRALPVEVAGQDILVGER